MKKIIILTFLAALLSGCNLQKIIPFMPYDNSNVKNSTVDVKKETIVISSLDSKKNRQKKHGVSISIEAINVVPELWTEVRLEEQSTFMVMNGQLQYIERRIPYYKGSSRLTFRIKISNNSKRVFRPKNAILTFNVDGDSASVDSKYYKALSKAIIVPNSSASFTVYGPGSDSLQKKKGNIHLGMYDVKTGDAMSNFEWYFKYKNKAEMVKHTLERKVSKYTKYEASIINGSSHKAK